MVSTETTHTPQGDGNQHDDVIACTLQRNNPHPTRGRKRKPSVDGQHHLGNNPHPARGRKPLSFSIPPVVNETTHTPQGDGNSGVFVYPSAAEKQPTPRKGTETKYVRLLRARLPKHPTPRKGTETAHAASCFAKYSKQPTPRKGTETSSAAGNSQDSAKQPTPRKGTETCQTAEILGLTFETTHTPQGGGKPFVFTLQKLLEKPFTSPTGDN